MVATQTVALPTAWVNTHECDGALTSPNQTINFPATGTGGSWTGGGPYTANSATSLNQAVADAESYRTVHQSTGAVLIRIPAGALFSSPGTTITLPQTAGDNSTSCIALATTGTLAVGRTVCAVDTTDVAAVRNPGCTSPNDVAQMWTLEITAGGTTALTTGAWDANGIGPHHYLVEGMEARPIAGLGAVIYYLVTFGSKGLNETALSQLASHIYLDRSWLHGDLTDAMTGSNQITHMLTMDCYICGATNSQWSQSENGGQQNQGIYINQGQGIKIAHNWLDGPGQGFICGGTSQVIPSSQLAQQCVDVEVRRNRFSYPSAWLGSSWSPSTGGSRQRIAPFEMKSAARVLVDGNIFENVDDSGSQRRPFGMNPKAYNNQRPQYFIAITDITWTNNIQRNICNTGAVFGTRSAHSPNGNGASRPLQNVSLQNNLWYNSDKPSFCNSPDGAGQGLEWGVGDTPFNCTAQRDSTGQFTTLTCADDGIGTSQTDTNVGDPVVVTTCADTSFNVGAGMTMGPPALAGTDPNGLTVVYSNPGTANTSTNGCVLDNFQGYPKNVTIAHNTLIFASGSFGLYVALNRGPSYGTMFAQNNTITDNIILGQGIQGQGPGMGDGLAPPNGLTRSFDMSTAVIHHNLYPGRNCSNYPDVLTAGGSLIQPATTSFCPSTPYCTWNDPTVGSCLGFNGLMSTGTMNVNLADWHAYRLCHAGDASCLKPSLYSRGQARQASDGADLGADLPGIDGAEASPIYTCTTSCGSGPFAD